MVSSTAEKSSVSGAGVAVVRPSDDALRGIATLADIQALIGQPLTDATDLGNGFEILDQHGKDRLIKVPCVFITWSINTGDMGDFVSAMVATIDGATGNVTGKFVINDGSTGILEQLRSLTDSGKTSMLYAKRGLRRSDYTVDLPDKNTGEMKSTSASTYYIDTSA